MTTFVVRFVKEMRDAFRGRVRHVASGEETTFGSYPELIAFFDEMRVLNGVVGSREDGGLLEEHAVEEEDESRS
jgi:hypothetical protein